MKQSQIPEIRIRQISKSGVSQSGRLILYWMNANRRMEDNFALQRAVEWRNFLNKPLVILESLRCDYRWSSLRFHQFVLEGMEINSNLAGQVQVSYIPLVETKPKQELDWLKQFSQEFSVVVTDDFPSVEQEERIHQAAKKILCRFEAVDSNGLFPLRAADRVFQRAFSFRQFLKKELAAHLAEFPENRPLSKLKEECRNQVDIEELERTSNLHLISLRELPIDHSVAEVDRFPGGSESAIERLNQFLEQKLSGYSEFRNQPEIDATSGLSPYLHTGQISPHTIFRAIAGSDGWSPEKINSSQSGKNWFGMSENAESFLDELITWRELGYNMAWQQPDYDQYDSLPKWAVQTLEEHSGDPRPNLYTEEELEEARTHDPLWNAAQNQLRSEGIIHNYLRMLWGKKILEWSKSPREAMRIMVHLNNKYAMDGRNPNSYSGIFWVLGRYDRPWGPERPIFGKIRYMSSENTARKFRVAQYIDRYGSV